MDLRGRIPLNKLYEAGLPPSDIGLYYRLLTLLRYSFSACVRETDQAHRQDLKNGGGGTFLWQAVLTYIPSLVISTIQLQISPIPLLLLISLIHLVISAIHLVISPIQRIVDITK